MNDDLTCAQADELLAGYALDSLLEEERCAFTAHLAECRRHDAELASFRLVASRLPDALEPMEPRSGLRDRLLSGFDDAVAGRPAPEAPRQPGGPLRLFGRPGFAYGLAALFLAVAIGLGGILASQDNESQFQEVTINQNGLSLQVLYLPDRNLAVFDASLPALPADRTYQAWQITAAGPVSLGLMRSQGATAFQADLSSADALAVSVEPLQGSPAPTTEPILVTNF